MKWLSPPDKTLLVLTILIDARNVSSVKLYRFMREKRSFAIENLSPNTVKIRSRALLKDLEDLLSRTKNLLKELAGFNINVCLDYWIKTTSYTCTCNKPYRYMNRTVCFENIDNGDTLAYCYSDSIRKTTILRFPKTKPIGNVDPFQLTRHLFQECGEPLSIAEYIDKSMREKLKLLIRNNEDFRNTSLHHQSGNGASSPTNSKH